MYRVLTDPAWHVDDHQFVHGARVPRKSAYTCSPTRYTLRGHGVGIWI